MILDKPIILYTVDQYTTEYDIREEYGPIPKSVVEQCVTHNVKLGYVSFLTILCMYAEEVAECDPLDLDESCIPPIEDLEKVLVYDYGYCEYFGVAKLVSVAKKFGLQSLATFNYKANRFKI